MTVIQHRRGTTAEWSASSYILEAGELGIEIDTSTTPDNVIGVKVGNGESLWSVLSYVGKGGLPVGGTAGQIVSKIDSTNYNAEWIDNYSTQTKYYVKLGETINKGQAVYVSAANGTNIIVSKASNNAEATSSKTIGLIETTGILNDIVKVVSDGLLSGFDTSAATVGDPVWLGTSGNLLFGLANKPVAPAHMVYLGVVTRVHATNGEIFVHVQNGFELDELHDVSISGKTALDVLSYDATGVWKNKTLANAGIAATAGATFTGVLNMNNQNITNVNHLTISDPGVNEGIEWLGGSGWKIFESPNALTNASGNLQFVTGSTRLATIDTSGNLDLVGGSLTTSATTANLFNTGATTLNIGGGATTAVNIGGINSTTTIAGNLVVNGTTTTINSTVLSVDDINIELGSITTPTDITANGGGITLKGATDKTLSWLSATGSWTSSENIALATGKKLYFNGGTSSYIDQTNYTGNAASVTAGVYTSGSYADPTWITSLAWSKIASKPTTLSGYGITDAQGLSTNLTALANVTAAANALPYFNGTTTAATTTLTSFGRSLIGAADAAATRTLLVLGDMALETKSNYALLSGASFSGTLGVTGTATFDGAVVMNNESSINGAKAINFYNATTPTNVRTGRIVGSGGTLYIQAGIDSTDTAGTINIARTTTSSTAISNFNVYSTLSTFNGGITITGATTATGAIAANGGITNSDATKPMSVAAGYTSAGGFSGTKVIMTATATGQTAPTLRPGGGALQAGDIWIGW